jgi:rhodanese-related sulfurtransferase
MKIDKQNQNVFAIGVGFFLIAGVALFTILGGSKEETARRPQESSSTPKADISGISSEALLQKISFRQSVTLIDLRSPESFASEHLLGARNFSLESWKIEEDGFDRLAEYVLIDDFGLTPTALEFIGYLAEKEFKNVAYLEGGFSGWKEKFNPTVSSGNPYLFSDQSKVNYISSDELKSTIDRGEDIFIIDMRAPEKFAAAHLKDAVNITLGELENKRADIPFSKKIIVAGDDALSSFQGAVKLFDIGFTNVYAVNEGFQ